MDMEMPDNLMEIPETNLDSTLSVKKAIWFKLEKKGSK